VTWASKSLQKDLEYVVIKHALRDMNGNLVGIKFRGGYAVVPKGSKAYIKLKQLPLVKDQPEFPILFLRELSFITRPLDVQMVYGQDVYLKYIAALEPKLEQEFIEKKEVEAIQHVEEKNMCAFTTSKGELCTHEVFPNSPSNFCKLHLLEDPALSSVGIVIPKRLTKEQKREYKAKVIEKLEKMSKKK
jgi:hypothetical protein